MDLETSTTRNKELFRYGNKDPLHTIWLFGKHIRVFSGGLGFCLWTRIETMHLQVLVKARSDMCDITILYIQHIALGTKVRWLHKKNLSQNPPPVR